MIRTCKWFNEDVITMLSSLWEQSSRLLSLHLIMGWKEKQLEKISIRHEPGKNSEFNRSNENFVESIIHVNDSVFDIFPLMVS